MDRKKFVLGGLSVFVVYTIFDILLNNGILRGTMESEPLKRLWRPDMADKVWIIWVAAFFWSFLFTLIYSKGYEGRGGVMEGVRYGFWVGLLMSIPMAFGSYVAYPIPYVLALQWFIFGTVQSVLCGITLAVVYKPAKPPVA
jgi:hypothetical protein